MSDRSFAWKAQSAPKEEQDVGLRAYLIGAASGSFALMLASTALGFANSFLLARLLGAEGYGVYSYAFSWAGLLSIAAVMGLDRILIREIAAYTSQLRWGLARGLFVWSGGIVTLLSLGLGLIAAVISLHWRGRLDLPLHPTFWIAVAGLPLVALMSITSAGMQGLRQVVVGKVPNVIQRCLLLSAWLLLTIELGQGGLSAAWAATVYVVSLCIAVGLGFLMLYRFLPSQIRKAVAEYDVRPWLGSALPLFMVASFLEINSRAGVLVLGSVAGAEATGVYSVARLIAESIAFILVAVNAAVAPVISSLYTAGQTQRLQRIVTLGARIVLLVALPVALGLILLRREVLQLFGLEFESAANALTILIIGQVANVAAGSVGNLLVMTGNERDVAISLAFSTGLTVSLSIIMIPLWGIDGAALAAICGTVLWNVLLVLQAYRRLGIDSTALGLGKWRSIT